VAQRDIKLTDKALLSLRTKIVAADQKFEAALSGLDVAQRAVLKMLPPKPAPAKIDIDPDPGFREKLLKVLGERKSRPETIAHEAAVQAWEKQRIGLEIECGLRAATRRECEAADRTLALRDTVAKTKATTLQGLIFKAVYAATHYPKEYDHDVACSIVDDLLAMRGEASDL
jgi:hypothetical protein